MEYENGFATCFLYPWPANIPWNSQFAINLETCFFKPDFVENLSYKHISHATFTTTLYEGRPKSGAAVTLSGPKINEVAGFLGRWINLVQFLRFLRSLIWKSPWITRQRWLDALPLLSWRKLLLPQAMAGWAMWNHHILGNIAGEEFHRIPYAQLGTLLDLVESESQSTVL